MHVKLSGDIEGAYVVTEKRPGGELVIAPDTAWKAMLERSGSRDVTAEELAEFEAEHGPFLPPDGEGAAAIMERLGHEPATLAEFEAAYGALKPPDGEG